MWVGSVRRMRDGCVWRRCRTFRRGLRLVGRVILFLFFNDMLTFFCKFASTITKTNR